MRHRPARRPSRRATASSLAAAVAVALASSTLAPAQAAPGGGPQATPSSGPHANVSAPRVRVDAPWVRNKSLTGKHSRVRLSVRISGGTPPYTWRATVGSRDHDVTVMREVGPAKGAAPLAAGTHTLTIGDTKFFTHPGKQQLDLTVVDANGVATSVASAVHVVGKLRGGRPTITGASGSTKKGAKRTLRGTAPLVGRMKTPYRVHFKASGATKFKPVGWVSPDPSGAWKLRSGKVRAGTYVVKVESKYLKATRSTKVRVPRTAFRRG